MITAISSSAEVVEAVGSDACPTWRGRPLGLAKLVCSHCTLLMRSVDVRR